MVTSAEGLRKVVDEAVDAWAREYRADGCPLGEVVRYILEGRGKRVRGVLALMSAQASGVKAEAAVSAAVALEMIHAYSLVHDDLPCMDNDDLRRGRPTAHRRFDEARALLGGDALLTDAFRVLSDSRFGAGPEVQLAWIRELAQAAGGSGMVLGQALDLHWTGKGVRDARELDRIHRHKTGCLLAASCAMGAMAARPGDETVDAFRDFGFAIGLVFQIVDDLLDLEGGTGKGQGKDQRDGKLTYLSLMSAEEARARAERLTSEACETLRRKVGDSCEDLLAYARGLAKRNK